MEGAIKMTAELESQAGIDYNPKALLGLAVAMTMMLTILTVGRIVFAICKSAAKPRKGKKPMWVRCFEMCFGNCDSYSGLAETEVVSATEPTPEMLRAQALRRSFNRGKPQTVMVDAEEDGADPIEIGVRPAAAEKSVDVLREAIADEIREETGEDCDPEGFILEAKTGSDWELIYSEADLDTWVFAKCRRVKRKFKMAAPRASRKGGAAGDRRGSRARRQEDDDDDDDDDDDEGGAYGPGSGGQPSRRAGGSRRGGAPEARVPKIPPPIVKDLSTADLSQQGEAPKMPAAKKVQAVLNHARATADGGPPEMWFEPFAQVDLGDESRSEVLTLVYPGDSISMAGVPQQAHGDPSIRNMDEYQHAPERITSVYMHTSDGQRFAAKVDVEGIASTDELLRGLRAAYCHYTTEGSPAYGALLTSTRWQSTHSHAA